MITKSPLMLSHLNHKTILILSLLNTCHLIVLTFRPCCPQCQRCRECYLMLSRIFLAVSAPLQHFHPTFCHQLHMLHLPTSFLNPRDWTEMSVVRILWSTLSCCRNMSR